MSTTPETIKSLVFLRIAGTRRARAGGATRRTLIVGRVATGRRVAMIDIPLLSVVADRDRVYPELIRNGARSLCQ
jgi:hypothetical protein